ncbi:hypothetical protein GVAV_003377 [Gurleya vavrai]
MIASNAIIGLGVNAIIFTTLNLNLRRVLGKDENFILVISNVRFHTALNDFNESLLYVIKFLPKYSPFLNPCEETFSAIKFSVQRNTEL